MHAGVSMVKELHKEIAACRYARVNTSTNLDNVCSMQECVMGCHKETEGN
jgi:hypothetical protein